MYPQRGHCVSGRAALASVSSMLLPASAPVGELLVGGARMAREKGLSSIAGGLRWGSEGYRRRKREALGGQQQKRFVRNKRRKMSRRGCFPLCIETSSLGGGCCIPRNPLDVYFGPFRCSVPHSLARNVSGHEGSREITSPYAKSLNPHQLKLRGPASAYDTVFRNMDHGFT